MAKKTDTTILIPAPNIKEMVVNIKGVTPLIYHKMSEKAKRQIREKQAKVATKGKEARDPQAEYIDSFYYDSNGEISFPALSIKQALVGAARVIEGVAMTEIRATVFVVGDANGRIPVLVDSQRIQLSTLDTEGPFDEGILGIDQDNPNIAMREDAVTIGMGTTDLRYRGQVSNWTMSFVVRFLASKISAAQVLNIVQYAGFACGLGEWRMERGGVSGAFEIVTTPEE